VPGEKDVSRRVWAETDAQGLCGDAGELDVFDRRAGEPGKLGGKRRAQAIESGEICRTGIGVGPRDEEVAQRGRIDAVIQSRMRRWCKRGAAGV
jgi:hypothetical protein